MKDYLNFEGLTHFLHKLFDEIFVSYQKQTLTDEQKEQAKENIGIVVATDEEIIDMMLEVGIMPVVQDTDGTILIDNDNTIILT